MHDLPLISTIAAAFTSAWLLGLLTQRLGLSPIVGYLLAGVVIGPHTPGFIGDVGLAAQLAEVGVILLMFGVGLHFHLKDLLAVRAVAIPGAVGQSLVATVLGIYVFALFGFSFKTGAVLGMAMAVASTVVLMRVLMDARALDSAEGHVAVGWLLVEDVFTVVVLVLIPVLGVAPSADPAAVADHAPAAPALGLWAALALALLKLTLMVIVVLVGGARVIPWVLVRVARLRSSELFTLTVLVFSIAIATAAYYVFGASMALGAFLAGMVVAQSPVSHQVGADALPMRDAFAVIFFVSVGMLFDPFFVVQQPLLLLAALGIILIAKPLAALVIVAALGHSSRTALTVALGLAQIGEFSFILSEVARKYGLMPDEGHNVLVASAIISITINPLLFRSLPAIEAWLRTKPRLWSLLNSRAERRLQAASAGVARQLTDHDDDADRLAIVVGYGPVGRTVDRLLREAGLQTVIIDLNMDTISELNAAGRAAIFGDASRDTVLEQAGARVASHLVLTLPHASERTAVVAAARNLNAELRIFVRARYLGERGDLEQAGASAAVYEEAEAAVALARLVMADTGASRDVIEQTVRDLRLRLILDNVSNLRSQTVRSAMVPWTRVHRLSTADSNDSVLRQVAHRHFSRWPVVDPHTGKPTGYLLAKDLVQESPGGDWTARVRPLQAVHPDDPIEAVLLRLQEENASICLVLDDGHPVGLLTIEDIIERVVGRIEDEYPRRPKVTLSTALATGAILLDLQARTAEQAIRELAAALPAERLPPGADVAALAIEREQDVATDVGFGLAIPHARCPHLRAPLLALGRSADGIMFSARSVEPVRLIFLLVTPADQPDLQVFMLGRIARAVGEPRTRERLLAATSEAEVLEIVAAEPEAQPA